jgi:hypothetical protein
MRLSILWPPPILTKFFAIILTLFAQFSPAYSQYGGYGLSLFDDTPSDSDAHQQQQRSLISPTNSAIDGFGRSPIGAPSGIIGKTANYPQGRLRLFI